MNTKKKYLIGIVGLFIAAILCSPVMNVMANDNKPKLNPPRPSHIHYNPPKPELYYDYMTDIIKYNQYPIWLIMKHNR
jgi:hypothetical protein